MSTVERNRESEGYDPLAKSREIVDLVLQVPHNASDTGRVLEAVGQVKADLHVLETYQNLARQLASGISPKDVDDTARYMQEAIALRPIDEVATENRILVLAGLCHLRRFAEFNERVAQSLKNGNYGNNGNNGITVFQAGLSPELVQRTIVHVSEVKQLVEEAPRTIQEANPVAEVILPPADPIQPEVVAGDATVDTQSIPIFTPPDNFISMQVGADAVAEKPVTPPISIHQAQPVSKKSGTMSRRDLFTLAKRGGIASVVLIVAGEVTGVTPIIKQIGEAIENLSTEEEKKLAEEVYIQKYSLPEKPNSHSPAGWEITYATVEKDEEFVDIFDGNFRGLVNSMSYGTPLYVALGENYPFQVGTSDIAFEVFRTKFQSSLPVVKFMNNSWYILSGRKTPISLGQRQLPPVIQVRNVNTKGTFYLEVTPIRISDGDRVSIRYMKKVKRSLKNI